MGGINVWKSDSRDQDWMAQSMWTPTPGFDRVHADIHGLSFTETGNLLAAHDGGVAYSIQGGGFSDTSEGLNIGQIYHFLLRKMTPLPSVQAFRIAVQIAPCPAIQHGILYGVEMDFHHMSRKRLSMEIVFFMPQPKMDGFGVNGLTHTISRK